MSGRKARSDLITFEQSGPNSQTHLSQHGVPTHRSMYCWPAIKTTNAVHPVKGWEPLPPALSSP